MKKIFPIIITCFLLISSLGIGVHSLATEQINRQEITLSFSQLTVEEKNNHIYLEIKGADDLFVKENHYMLPTHVDTYFFPFGTEIIDIQCNPQTIHTEVLTKKLPLTPEPQLANSIISNNYETVNPIAINTWYTYDIGAGVHNNQRNVIVKIQVFPIQYNPSKDELRWAENIQLDILYTQPFEQPTFLDDEYLFLVLSPLEYKQELSDLIDHKNNREISTNLVTLDEIYNGEYFPVQGRDDAEKIKYFIKNAVENWGTSYVLLVGGSQQFPTRTTHVRVNGDQELFVSDLYYADIYNETGSFSSWDTNENDIFGEYNWGSSRETDEVDLYPDVYLGRLACINSNEVTTCVDKIITYEQSEAYTQEWFTDIVVVGGDSFPGDNNDPEKAVSEGEYVNEEVLKIMDGFIPRKIWDSNGKLGSITPTGVQNINSAINEGCGFVDFSGHGNTNVWATHPRENENKWIPTPAGYYLNVNVKTLNNGNKLPIVITGACSVAKFNKDPDCFSWSFVPNPDGGGIASCGATALGYAYIGKSVKYGLIEGIAINMFEAYNDGAITFGEMWVKAVTDYISPRMDGGDYKTVEEWEPFGDPTLSIGEESQPPLKPERPNGPTSGNINTEYAYTASTTDPEGDRLYYLFDWGDGSFSSWVGPYDSGATAEVSHKWEEKGEYQIRVKARDEHGVQSEWSDPLPITMPKNKPLHYMLFSDLLARLYQLFPFLKNILDLNLG
jgi:hypothetical protein